MYYVYVLQSENKRRYIGMTRNLIKRVFCHNNGQSLWSKRYKCWKCVYVKVFDIYTNARKWELHLKRQKGGNGFRKIMEKYSQNKGTVAQGLEQAAHNHLVAGSNPAGPTQKIQASVV